MIPSNVTLGPGGIDDAGVRMVPGTRLLAVTHVSTGKLLFLEESS